MKILLPPAAARDVSPSMPTRAPDPAPPRSRAGPCASCRHAGPKSIPRKTKPDDNPPRPCPWAVLRLCEVFKHIYLSRLSVPLICPAPESKIFLQGGTLCDCLLQTDLCTNYAPTRLPEGTRSGRCLQNSRTGDFCKSAPASCPPRGHPLHRRHGKSPASCRLSILKKTKKIKNSVTMHLAFFS